MKPSGENEAFRKELTREWARVREEHPLFARAFLAQQAILLEASELGNALIATRMCWLLELGLPVLFVDYWAARCRGDFRFDRGLFQCIAHARKLEDCFDLPHESDWFEDPFAEGRRWPPVLPGDPAKS